MQFKVEEVKMETQFMAQYSHGGPELGRIHRRNNDKKFFAHFTGFLQGIAASGYIEVGEVEPLIAECEEFVRRVSDVDAYDIVQDFDADLLEHENITDVVEVRMQELEANCEKSLLNRFLGFCRGVVCDGKITLPEATAISSFIEEYPFLLDTIGVKQISVSTLDAIEDGIISEEESDEICEVIGHVVGDCYGDTGIA